MDDKELAASIEEQHPFVQGVAVLYTALHVIIGGTLKLGGLDIYGIGASTGEAFRDFDDRAVDETLAIVHRMAEVNASRRTDNGQAADAG